MTLKFAIVQAKLANSPTGYAARVLPAGTIDFEQLVEQVAGCNTSVSKSDVLGVIEDYHTVIENLLRLGFNVITPHVRYRSSIQGNFLDQGDAYDAARHRVRPRLSVGVRLLQSLANVDVEKVPTVIAVPQPLTFVDVDSGARNTTVTPGRSGRLIGRNLRYDPADPHQGVFFLDANGKATRVEDLIWSMPKHLIFTIPPLAAGKYKLEVRAILNDNHELRTGLLPAVLTVS